MDEEVKEDKLESKPCCVCGREININRTAYGTKKGEEGHPVFYHLFDCLKNPIQ